MLKLEKNKMTDQVSFQLVLLGLQVEIIAPCKKLMNSMKNSWINLSLRLWPRSRMMSIVLIHSVHLMKKIQSGQSKYLNTNSKYLKVKVQVVILVNYCNRSTSDKSLNESDDFQESLILSKMTEGHAHAILQPICKLNSVMMETTKIVRPQLWSLKEPKWLIFYLWFYVVIWIWCDPTKFMKSNVFVDG